MDSIYSDFAYDDAFRTMVVKCDELLIPFINYMFDMNYSKKARIYRNANERYLDQQGGSQDKRITDSLIKIPFYSFNYKNEFEDIEKDEDKQEQFIDVYRNIIDMLEELVSEELLSAFSKDVIISLINKVSYKQLMRYQDTQKKVGDLMGGKVLDLDIIRAHDAGLEEGREEGIKKGREEGRESTLASSIRSMMSKLKLSAEEAMDTLDIPKNERSKYMTKL